MTSMTPPPETPSVKPNSDPLSKGDVVETGLPETVVVPRKLTKTMLEAGFRAGAAASHDPSKSFTAQFEDIWEALLAAAPTPPVPEPAPVEDKL